MISVAWRMGTTVQRRRAAGAGRSPSSDASCIEHHASNWVLREQGDGPRLGASAQDIELCGREEGGGARAPEAGHVGQLLQDEDRRAEVE